MPLPPGTLFGLYEIAALIGAGTLPITQVLNWTAALKK